MENKKTFLTLILFVLLNCFVMGQTTREEYDYCTKGIKTQIANGLDVTKKGYAIDTLGQKKFTYNGYDNSAVLTFYGLRSTSSKKLKAISVVYEKYLDKNLITQEFFCIPTENANDDLWVETWQTINGISLQDGNNDANSWIMYCLMKFVSQLAK